MSIQQEVYIGIVFLVIGVICDWIATFAAVEGWDFEKTRYAVSRSLSIVFYIIAVAIILDTLHLSVIDVFYTNSFAYEMLMIGVGYNCFRSALGWVMTQESCMCSNNESAEIFYAWSAGILLVVLVILGFFKIG